MRFGGEDPSKIICPVMSGPVRVEYPGGDWEIVNHEVGCVAERCFMWDQNGANCAFRVAADLPPIAGVRERTFLIAGEEPTKDEKDTGGEP
jgi:hypothetical protein